VSVCITIASVITATELARNLSDVLNQVRYQGMSFDIKRGAELIAHEKLLGVTVVDYAAVGTRHKP
jgi:hypothetical protein